jgi:hypothetical protein
MKRSKFTEAQIAFILRQGEEGTAVGEICRQLVDHARATWQVSIRGACRALRPTARFVIGLSMAAAALPLGFALARPPTTPCASTR